MDRETADEIKRYVKILFEEVDHKLQLLAEGQQGMTLKLEAVEQGLKTAEQGFATRSWRHERS